MDVTNRMDALLGQMRTAQALIESRLNAAAPKVAKAVEEGPKADFATALRASIDQVNAAQKKTESMVRAFESGSPDVKLHDVMIDMAKSGVAFQQMVQVRNRLVSAYQDVMNMQV